MTYDEYWFGDCRLTIHYRKAFDVRRRQTNEQLWLGGIYTMKAFSEVLKSAFGKGEKAKYFDKPLDIYPKPQDEKEKEIQKQRDTFVKQLNMFKKNFDSKGGGKNG